jgi:ell wall binding domain 2 (CWB2)
MTSQSSAEPLAVQRLGGATRADTAVEISHAAWPAGADTVLLARSDAYPDALSAPPLAAALDAPLLLTHPQRLEGVVADELQRLDARDVILLGGTGALSSKVERAVAELGVDVLRIQGADRFATSEAIADQLRAITGSGDRSAYVARATQGKGWADALAVAPLAGRQGRPLLLADFSRLPYSAHWLSVFERLTLVGGEAVLDDVLLRAPGRTATRISGPNRYATSLELAETALHDLRAAGRAEDGFEVWLTTGTNFPDALAAGPAVAHRDAVLLLAPPSWGSSATRAWIAEHADQISGIRLLGAQAAISDHVAADLARMDPNAPDSLAPPSDEYVLMYSESGDLSNPRPLEGAVVYGEIHIFVARCDDEGRCDAEW